MLTSRQRNLSFRYSDLVSVWGPGLVGMVGAAVKGWVIHDASESPRACARERAEASLVWLD